jgi:hypothetical protein
MTDDEIIALAHKYIEFDQGKIDGATFNAELAKCRDTGELIAVGTACKMLKGKGLVISSDTPDNPLYDRSKQIERRLTGSVKEDVGMNPLGPLRSWSDLRGMPRDITGDLAPVIGEPITQDDLEMTRQAYERTVHVWAIPHRITIHQKSGTMWEAVGDYKGERIEVKGSSANVTAKWVEAARSKDS